MPRKALERDNFHPYHVYNRSIESNFYPINSKVLWNKSAELLSKISEKFGAKIHSFVLMSNHYHLLISTPKKNLDECMWYYQSCFANWICKITERKIYSFESRYKWSIIKDPHQYLSVYKYVARNPVRAGLSKTIYNYPFSSFGDVRLKELLVDHEYTQIIDQKNLSDWMNTESSAEVIEKTRRGLKHALFRPPQRINAQRGVAPLCK